MKKVQGLDENCILTIVDLSWDRIYLTLKVKAEYPCDRAPETPLIFYGVNESLIPRIRFQQKQDGDYYYLKVNITNQGENICIPNGAYTIYAFKNGRAVDLCAVSPELVHKLPESSRNFLYSKRSKVYSVTFCVAENENMMPFCMHVMASEKTATEAPSERLFSLKKLSPSALLNKKRKPILSALYRSYRKKYQNKSKTKKTILFMTEQNSELGANQLAVIKRMRERGLDQEFDILTNCRIQTSESQSISSWIRLIRKLAMSGMIILDDHAPILDWLVLDSSTSVIQLWHAGAGFKAAGYSRWGHQGCPPPFSAYRQIRYGAAGSKNIAHFFSEAWGIATEQVLPTGMPRIDEYLDSEHREKTLAKLYEEFPICKNKKVILFAPTYRGISRKDANYPYELIDFEGLYNVCSDEYVVLFKMHPWVKEPVPIDERFRDKFIDVNSYPNINDLFYFTDLLITDYSSNIFEYSLMKKPMLFFAFDKIQYSISRGFHRPYEESAPGKICCDFASVLQAIKEKDFEEYKVQEYVDHHFDYLDTNSSDRVIDWIILGNIPPEITDGIQAVKNANDAMNSAKIDRYDEEI